MTEMVHGSLSVLGVGLVTVGAGIGIGLIGAAGVEGVARQPEAMNKIQTVMLIAAALVEGIALFAAVLCFITLNN